MVVALAVGSKLQKQHQQQECRPHPPLRRRRNSSSNRRRRRRRRSGSSHSCRGIDKEACVSTSHGSGKIDY